MYERFKELLVAAGIYECDDFDPHPTLINFAQLIVNECAVLSENDIADGDACCTNTAYRIAAKIRKHFGVEQ